MKTSIFTLLLVLTFSSSWAETACRAVEYADRTEAICVGDEKSIPDQNAPSTARTSSESVSADTKEIANKIPPNKTSADKIPTAIQTKPVTQIVPAKNEASTARRAPETAAEHLARRKSLAERTTKGLSNVTIPAAK